MDFLKLLLIVLLAFILIGCKAKIKTIETHSTDTIYKSEIVKITPSSLNEIVIENVCDSLGHLKIINVSSSTGNTRTYVKSTSNELRIGINIDSIVNSRVNEFKSSYKTEKVTETIIKYKNKKLMWYSLILNTLLLGWIFKKPLLNLLKLIV